ncbi:MAG: hypothetical protein ABIH23_30095 [bacterium]
MNVRPAADGKGVVLHLREVDGRRTEVGLDFPTLGVKRMETVNVLGEIIDEGVGGIFLDPFEVMFVKLGL